MIKIDPILAVQNVAASAQWYQEIFAWKSIHGGDTFDVLTDENGAVVLCLHKWGEHEHPTMLDDSITPGNGLILYFRVDNLDEIREKAIQHQANVEKDIYINPNTGSREITLRDPDAYFLIISEYHNYGV